MDDYTWRLQLRARKISSYNRTLTMLVIVFFALAVGSVLWYFFIHARSPEYALAEIQEAAEKHDAEKFERYVNVSLSMGRVYDDLTRSLFAADTSLANGRSPAASCRDASCASTSRTSSSAACSRTLPSSDSTPSTATARRRRRTSRRRTN